MKTLYKLASIAVLLTLQHTAIAEMAEYSSAKSLLVKAIDSPDGTARGILTGPIANFFGIVTRSNYPVTAHVTTVGEFSQPGCKRLNLHLSQQGVKAESGDERKFDVAYGINFCRDGDAPRPGIAYQRKLD